MALNLTEKLMPAPEAEGQTVARTSKLHRFSAYVSCNATAASGAPPADRRRSARVLAAIRF